MHLPRRHGSHIQRLTAAGAAGGASAATSAVVVAGHMSGGAAAADMDPLPMPSHYQQLLLLLRADIAPLYTTAAVDPEWLVCTAANA